MKNWLKDEWEDDPFELIWLLIAFSAAIAVLAMAVVFIIAVIIVMLRG